MTILNIVEVISAGPDVTVVTAPFGPRGPVIAGTSDSVIAIGLGARTLVMNEFGLGFTAGVRIRCAVNGATGYWFEGEVSTYDIETKQLVMLSDLMAGSGTYADWIINVAGQPGKTGPQGPDGPQGPQGVPGISLDSPEFIGTPKAPTAPLGTDTNQIATCEFVYDVSAGYQLLDPQLTALASVSVTGNQVPYFINPTTIGTITVSTYGAPFLNLLDAPAARSYIGAQPVDADLTSLAAASGTNTLYYRSANNIWSPVTIGTNLTFSGGTLSAAGGGAGGFITGVEQPMRAPGGLLGINLDTTMFAVDAGNGNLVFATNAVLRAVPAAADDSLKIAPTSWVQANFAKLSSPALTGVPTAPTAAPGTNTAQIATCAFVTAGYLRLAGGTMSGDLVINKSQPIVGLYKAADTSAIVAGYNAANGFARWSMVFGDNSAESGSNAGSNFAVTRYADNGTGLGVPIHINRQTGKITLENSVALVQANNTIALGNGLTTQHGGLSASMFVSSSWTALATAQSGWIMYADSQLGATDWIALFSKGVSGCQIRGNLGGGVNAGMIGETIEGSTMGGGVGINAGTGWVGLVAITLSPGDWDVNGWVHFTFSDPAVSYWYYLMITTTPGAPGAGYTIGQGYSGWGGDGGEVGPVTLKVTATTTYYLATLVTFASGSVQMPAVIRARRSG